MSLDIYLTLNGAESPHGSGVFVREDGQVKEISREEWEEKFPGREPVIADNSDEDNEVYWCNITHNLGRMAAAADIYGFLWRPDENEISYGSELIEPLSRGLEILKADPGKFKAHNPPNGWGNYEALVGFVTDYLAACRKYPQAKVSVSR